jgi:hypothetical protein
MAGAVGPQAKTGLWRISGTTLATAPTDCRQLGTGYLRWLEAGHYTYGTLSTRLTHKPEN